ncbi:tyrosine phosphatase family protein [Orientia chuto str. Dubai]|uniref:Tyrosine phosphatase family protein n=1 Tax=Orientia chuto str. Dubai TaxID=1359168 RepID=A0A0F3MPC5_9RICK|nr:hypothetical protein [Candidatus Orientia mediorientalis]KJV56464.1 tyrosine phosphatase family protein [Orientia chuto str. Dubai]
MDNKQSLNHISIESKLINTDQNNNQQHLSDQQLSYGESIANLQDVQQSVCNLINEHFQKTDIDKLRKQYSTDNHLLDKLVTRLYSQLNANSNSKFFDSLIAISRQSAEAKQGIMHFRYKNQPILGSSKTSEVIVRDCRLQSDSNLETIIPIDKKPGEIPEHWLAVIANQARACCEFANMYLDQDSALHAKDSIVNLLKASKDRMMQKHIAEKELETISLKFNEQSLKVLKKYNNSAIPVSKDNIALIRDYSNFNDDHEHVVTISSEIDTSAKYPVIASMIAAPLSKNILQEYFQIANSKLEHNENIVDSTLKQQKAPLWFQKLSTLEQDLIIKQFEKITDNKHMLPTSLRNLPGLKNAYLEVRGISEDKQLLNSHLECRSGTLAQFSYSDKNEACRITNLNFKRAVELFDKHKVNIECLNTEFSSKRGILHNCMAAVMTEERRICNLMHKGIKSVEDGKSKQQLANLNIIATNNAATNYKNQALDTIAARSNTKKGNKISWITCKSGKDRTGIVAANNFITQLCNSIKQDNSKIAHSVMMSNHSEFLAGHHGCSRGTAGLKASGVFAGLKGHILSPYKNRMTPSAIANTNYIHFNSTWRKIANSISNIKKAIISSIKTIANIAFPRKHKDDNLEIQKGQNYKNNLNLYQDIQQQLDKKIVPNLKNHNMKISNDQYCNTPLNLRKKSILKTRF